MFLANKKIRLKTIKAVLGREFDYEMNRVYVYLEHLSIDSSDEYDLKAYVDSHLSHDWGCSYYGFEK
ncbi:hypothetical protein [Psychrobacillus psychrotolerans]|uniref:hypothetical protein n=1 Tax=Psychrobacillus psychrotolerans TaxID=126156 RepID=UPI003B02A2EC